MRTMTSKMTLKKLWENTSTFFPHPLDKGIYTLTGKVPMPTVYFGSWIVTRKLLEKNTDQYKYQPMLITNQGSKCPIPESDSLDDAKMSLVEYLTKQSQESFKATPDNESESVSASH